MLFQIPLGNFHLPGILDTTGGCGAFGKFNSILSTTIGLMTICAGLWFLLQVFTSAFQWLNAGAEKQAVENSRKRLINAVVGLFVVVIAYALISITGLVLGLNILDPINTLFNIAPC